MRRDLPPKPRRRTTKRFVWVNIILAWGTIWACAALAPEALQWLATPVVLLIVGIFGFYTGTGTTDMFAALANRGSSPESTSNYSPNYSSPPDGFVGGNDDRVG